MDNYPECSQALFTDVDEHLEDNRKEYEGFPEYSQSILQNFPLKRKFEGSRTCLDTESTDSSLDEITDSDEHVAKKLKIDKLPMPQNNDSLCETKTSPACCAAKKYFNTLFAKDLKAELNTENELPPIYAQFEHDLGIMLAFKLRNVPANRRFECYEKLIGVIRQYED